jgi:hypothetical protein
MLNYLGLRAVQEKLKTLLNYCTKRCTILKINVILKTDYRVKDARLDTHHIVHEE